MGSVKNEDGERVLFIAGRIGSTIMRNILNGGKKGGKVLQSPSC